MDLPTPNQQATAYLSSLISKTLRVTTTDTRMFLGQFKCTDSDRNIILSHTFEYRLPPPPTPSSTTSNPETKTITQDLSSRYLGLVVIPGEFIQKIEVEEWVSQMKGRAKEKENNALREGGIGGTEIVGVV